MTNFFIDHFKGHLYIIVNIIVFVLMELVSVSINTSKNQVITQSNHLTEARYTLTIAEQRLVLTLLSLISPNDDDFKEYEIKVLDFKNLFNIKTNAVYEQFREVLKRLASRVIYIPKTKGGKDYLISHWFSSAEYDSSVNSVRISFDKKLKPYLIQLKEQFKEYKLFILTQFKSIYTIRIYMLLKQYEKIGFREFELEEFRSILDIKESEYQKYADFRKRVLDQAKKEFETKNKETGGYISDINFELETIRTGREITRLRFNIKKQTYQEALPMEIPEVSTSEQSSTLEALQTYGISEEVSKKCLADYSEEEILRAIQKFEQQKEQGKVKANASGYLLTMIKNGAGKQSKDEQEQEEKQKKKVKAKAEAEQRKAVEAKKLELEKQFSTTERERFLQEATEEEKQRIFKLVQAENPLCKAIGDLEKRSSWSFAIKHLAGYEDRKKQYLEANL